MAARGARAAAGDAGNRDSRCWLRCRADTQVAAVRKGLAEGGHQEGQNVALEFRWAEGQSGRVGELAADLVRRRVSVIVTPGSATAALAAKAATTTIPIVFGAGGDPVKEGLVASLNRPGGNATGVNFFTVELVAKRMQFLREIADSETDRRAGQSNRSGGLSNTARRRGGCRRAANSRSRGLTGRDIDAAFASIAHEKADALFVSPARSSTPGVSSLPYWRHVTHFRRSIRSEPTPKLAG